MRTPSLVFVLICALFAAACSAPEPPRGRWEGVYESADTMVVGRAEIGADGLVRVSAPNQLNIAGATEESRIGMRERLSAEIAEGWGDVVPRKLDFDGSTFRKPGGVAPQMEWDGKKMTLVVYFGANPALRIPLRGVREFSDDPFNP